MRHVLVITAVALISAMLTACGGSVYIPRETNLPISSEATLVEVVSACEIMVLAAGIGEGEEKHLDSLASLDARKSAVLFALKGGTDPLLQTQPERSRFGLIQEDLFAGDNFRKYVSYEQSEYDLRVFIEGKAKLRVKRHFKINRCNLQQYLVDNGIIEELVAKELGMPQIAVIPISLTDEDPVTLLKQDPDKYHAATVIESHLTTLGYDVVLLSQSQQLDDLIRVAKYFKEAQTDNEYLTATCIGADIYITFTVQVESGMVGGQETRKAISTVKAFETTTGRLLGSETGYSGTHQRNADLASRPAVIEAAINDAVGKVLSRVQAYWKKDMDRGLQYKLHFALDAGLTPSVKEETKFAVHRILKDRAKIIKPKISTENNFDYLIWVDPEEISDFVDLQMQLKSDFRRAMPSVSIVEVFSNMKLVIYELK